MIPDGPHEAAAALVEQARSRCHSRTSRSSASGVRHLGWKLGETARGLRVLRAFPRCPDPWALG